MSKTAEDYRKEARAAQQRRDDSWERSDTDGFVTQWACGLSASLANTRATILENDGKAEFTGLYEGTRRVVARTIRTQYGSCWLLHESEAELISKRGSKFVPVGGNSRVQKKLGLRECLELAPAWAALDGEGTGLSGRAWVSTYRSGDKWGADAALLEQEG